MPIIKSILDSDQYKFSMQQAVSYNYPRVEAEYKFINRNNTSFPSGFARRLRNEIDSMEDLYLSPDEESFLRERCYYFNPTYIDILRGYRYDPSQVMVIQIGGDLSVSIKGPWYQTLLWEVPLLAMISELYYKMTNQPAVSGWQKKLLQKLDKVSEAGCVVSDFGTRRRHSSSVHDWVIKNIQEFKCCSGTSNVYLAYKYNLTPIGTMAHEWVMGHACMYGFRRANIEMMKAWVKVYNGELGVALPDTFTTDVFLRDFNTLYAKLFDGVRWDSGDWKWFTDLMVSHWKKLNIDPLTKSIVYSDGLTDLQAIEIQKYAEGKVLPRFGIGTFLTNSVGRTPLNIVIKMTKCDGYRAVKISDSPGKESGLSEDVINCKNILEI